MNDAPDRRFFFVHVMKTGGASFRQHVYANFQNGEVYPDKKLDMMHRANLRIDYLLSLDPARRAAIRAYTGHFPFVVSELLGDDLVTLTVLREPVERTVSYLKHCKRYHDHHHDLALEEIYEDPFYFSRFIHNHQTKIFSMTTDDQLRWILEAIDIDEHRLSIAKANLEKVDVIGLTEHYAEFLDVIHRHYGWQFATRPSRRVSDEPWTVTPALRRRIAADNQADMAFYDHARQLHQQRRGTAISRLSRSG